MGVSGSAGSGVATGVGGSSAAGGTTGTDASTGTADAPASGGASGFGGVSATGGAKGAGGSHGTGGYTGADGSSGATDTGARYWKPAPNTTFYWDLTNAPPDNTKNVGAYDIDGWDNTTAEVTTLHALVIKVVCYMDAGTYEPASSKHRRSSHRC